MGEFRMPALGAGMELGRILEWYVVPGQRVERGDLIALVETDKANIDVEVFETGIVEELLVAEGTRVPVGTAVAMIATEEVVGVGSDAPSAADAAVSAPPTADDVVRAPSTADDVVRAPSPAPIVTSPLVRRQAAAAGVDLTRVRGTGRGGLITRADVAAAAQRAGVRSSPFARRLAAERGADLRRIVGTGPGGARVGRDVPARATSTPDQQRVTPSRAQQRPTPADAQERALTMRQAITRAMEQSNREIPHYHLTETVDVEGALVWLAERNADVAPAERILPAALVLRATAQALVTHPGLNGYWVDGAFRDGPGIHLGVAINLRGGGLLAPAIHHADQRSLEELMAALRDLVERTRAGGLRGSELTDPTITVSNLGDTGVESLQGVITPPQVALVGAGRITARPWVIDGTIEVRRTIVLSLAGDHRASDGHLGARFLAAVASELTRTGHTRGERTRAERTRAERTRAEDARTERVRSEVP